MNRKRIIERLRKILAKASARANDNENERAVALAMANKLMQRYRIERVELEHDSDGVREHCTASISRDKWEPYVFLECARLVGATCAWSRTATYTNGRRKVRLVFLYGRTEVCELANEIAKYCVNSIRDEARTQRPRGVSAVSFRVSFGFGAACGIQHQVEQILRTMRRRIGCDENHNDKALVVASYDDDLRRARELMAGVSSPARGKAVKIADADACAAGYLHGRNLALQDRCASPYFMK